MSEQELQAAILDAFARIGVMAWRVNAGKVKVRGGWMQLAPPGTPDVLVIVPPSGRLLGLEVKTRNGRERSEQIAWAERARTQGAAVMTVRSEREALDAFRAARRAA